MNTEYPTDENCPFHGRINEVMDYCYETIDSLRSNEDHILGLTELLATSESTLKSHLSDYKNYCKESDCARLRAVKFGIPVLKNKTSEYNDYISWCWGDGKYSVIGGKKEFEKIRFIDNEKIKVKRIYGILYIGDVYCERIRETHSPYLMIKNEKGDKCIHVTLPTAPGRKNIVCK